MSNNYDYVSTNYDECVCNDSYVAMKTSGQTGKYIGIDEVQCFFELQYVPTFRFLSKKL